MNENQYLIQVSFCRKNGLDGGLIFRIYVVCLDMTMREVRERYQSFEITARGISYFLIELQLGMKKVSKSLSSY